VKWLGCAFCEKPSQVRITREVKTAKGTSRKRIYLCGEHYRASLEVMGVGL
jgi:hypothetical protein